MSQDEKPSGQFRIPSTPSEPDEVHSKDKSDAPKHKVIADIHSGLVLVAPVRTAADEDSEFDDEEPPSKPLN